MGNIVVVGSSNTDLTVQVTELPRPGETVLGGEFYRTAGGKGANQAVAAARAGGHVSFVGCVGEDAMGRQALRNLTEEGIDTEHVVATAEAPSGVALIMVDAHGENSIAVAPGANAMLRSEILSEAKKVIAEADVLIAQLETPIESVERAVQTAAEGGATVILNPAPAQPLERKVLKHVSVLTPNAAEAEQLTGIAMDREEGLRKAASRLRAQGVERVLITLGPRGVFLSHAAGDEFVPGLQVQTIDTTAAGDVFNGALAVALSEGHSLLEAVHFANTAAALSVTVRGAQRSVPLRRDIDAALARSGDGVASHQRETASGRNKRAS